MELSITLIYTLQKLSVYPISRFTFSARIYGQSTRLMIFKWLNMIETKCCCNGTFNYPHLYIAKVECVSVITLHVSNKNLWSIMIFNLMVTKCHDRNFNNPHLCIAKAERVSHITFHFLSKNLWSINTINNFQMIKLV